MTSTTATTSTGLPPSSINPFDAMAQAYLEVAEPTSSAFATELLISSDLAPGSTVLDVACGTGALAYPVAQRGHTVVAVDRSAGMVEVARRRLDPYPAASAEVMDAIDLRFDAGTFDAAFSVFGVSLFADAVRTGLEEMTRVVRPGGVVGIAHWADFAAPAILVMLRAKAAVLGQAVTRPPALTESDLVDHFEQLGLRDIATGSMIFIDEPVSPEVMLDRYEPIFGAVPGYPEFRRDHGDDFREAFAREARNAEGTDLMTARACYVIGLVPGRKR